MAKKRYRRGSAETGYFQLDPAKVRRRMLEKRLTRNAVIRECLQDARTTERVLDGNTAVMKSVMRVLEVLDVQDPLELAPNDELDVHDTPKVVMEWEVGRKVFREPVRASNGLVYSIHEVRHLYVASRWGRGKCYNLSAMSTRNRVRAQAGLERHHEVCNRIGIHPNIPIHETSFPDSTGNEWWVIDRWFDGEILDSYLDAHAPLDKRSLQSIMGQMGEGLKALHSVGVIRRELAPRFVVYDAETDRIVLTDFELGKLLDGSQTVSADWPSDDYRAVEVGSEDEGVDKRADVYSWGRILVKAATGELPAVGHEPQLLDLSRLPKGIVGLAKACVSHARQQRPDSMEPVLKALRRWA